MAPPPGQHDYSGVRLTRHALERFVERFGGEAEEAADTLRAALSRTKRLGRNPDNGAVAVLAVCRGRALVALLQETTCLTVLTWHQFLPHLAEFGRNRLPRKWGRALDRLIDPALVDPSQHPAEERPRADGRDLESDRSSYRRADSTESPEAG